LRNLDLENLERRLTQGSGDDDQLASDSLAKRPVRASRC